MHRTLRLALLTRWGKSRWFTVMACLDIETVWFHGAFYASVHVGDGYVLYCTDKRTRACSCLFSGFTRRHSCTAGSTQIQPMENELAKMLNGLKGLLKKPLCRNSLSWKAWMNKCNYQFITVCRRAHSLMKAVQSYQKQQAWVIWYLGKICQVHLLWTAVTFMGIMAILLASCEHSMEFISMGRTQMKCND